MPAPPDELLDLLRRHDPVVQSIAFRLRGVVVEELAPCHEYGFAMRSKVALLYSGTPRAIQDGICQIGVFSRHVTLVFVEGIALDDPAGLLAGTGKIMRHVRIASAEEADRPAIRTLLQQARRNAGLGPRRGNAGEVVTRVKSATRTVRSRSS